MVEKNLQVKGKKEEERNNNKVGEHNKNKEGDCWKIIEVRSILSACNQDVVGGLQKIFLLTEF